MTHIQILQIFELSVRTALEFLLLVSVFIYLFVGTDDD